MEGVGRVEGRVYKRFLWEMGMEGPSNGPWA